MGIPILGLRTLTAVPRQLTDLLGVLPDLVAAIMVIPDLARQLERIGENTETLPEMRDAIVKMSHDTECISRLEETMSEVAKHTDDISETMPALVALEASLPTLEPVMTELGRMMERLTVSLAELETTTRTLASVAGPLQGAAERLGRFSERRAARRTVPPPR